MEDLPADTSGEAVASGSTSSLETGSEDQRDVKPYFAVPIRSTMETLIERQNLLIADARGMDLRFDDLFRRITDTVDQKMNCMREGIFHDLAFIRHELHLKFDQLHRDIDARLNQLASSQNAQTQRLDPLINTNAQGLHEVQVKLQDLESCLNEIKEVNNRAELESNRDGVVSPAGAAEGEEVILAIAASPHQQQQPPPSSERSRRAARKRKSSDREDCPQCGKNLSRAWLNKHIETTCKMAPKRKR